MNRDLFDHDDQPLEAAPRRRPSPAGQAGGDPASRPLADRLRPRTLDEMVGQASLLDPEGPFRPLLTADVLPSLLLWGPPGCGKTTLARLVAMHADARFLEFSAVRIGAKELKEVMTEAEKLRQVTGRRTVLFLDEIHRFTKAQQDALLPWVERGDITLVGATTENPSFELNAALLSRLRLFVLQPLAPPEVADLLRRALERPEGLAGRRVQVTERALLALAELSEGDARQALGLLDSITAAVAERGHQEASTEPGPVQEVDVQDLQALIQHRAVRYDKAGEEHYNLISALHKSLRNSDVQASLYWLVRMLEGGEDVRFLSRRLVILASEDIGNADPRSLMIAVAAMQATEFVGLPECQLTLAQAVTYLALAPKSNACTLAIAAARKDVREQEVIPVPRHLQDRHYAGAKRLGHGEGYEYAHDAPAGIAAQDYLGVERTYYEPTDRGLERELAERLAEIRRRLRG